MDKGASEIDAYVASWRFLMAVEFASLVLSLPKAQSYLESKPLSEFLTKNYGAINPNLGDIIRAPKISLEGLSIAPQIFGNALGGVNLSRSASNANFGHEINALSESILESVVSLCRILGRGTISLHFDELDQGLSKLDENRKIMLIGLVVAARDIKRKFSDESFSINSIIYLRTDIWDQMEFSDKNKISQSVTLELEWNSDSLLDMTNRRIEKFAGENYSWDDISTSDKMRGTQEKWKHIVTRTFLRPRDVIQFMNCILDEIRKSSNDVEKIENPHIVNSREKYSSYLKAELDDEIKPHWSDWERALQVCSAIGAITFSREEFETEYERRKATDSIPVSDALELLYAFSVIGYQARSGYGGSGWKFKYSDPESPWDAVASRLKVHLGLKEFAKLQEERKAVG